MPTSTAFGIDVHCDERVQLLDGAQAESTGRSLSMALETGEATAASLRAIGRLLCDERKPDGRVSFQIETQPGEDYLIWGPDYGFHRLSSRGSRLRVCPGDSDGHEWQRLLIGQVLPFATLLHGLEVFHASAVVLDGRALALIGPSGSGKTSLALELRRLGCDFLADDVLALEVRDGELLGHPGPPVAGVDRGEARRLQSKAGAGQAQTVEGKEVLWENDRELLVRTATVRSPAPLEALFFIDRSPGGPSDPRFESVTDPKLLLSATFNFVHVSANRLRGLLEVSSLASRRRVERVSAGPAVSVERLGEAVMRRMGAECR